MKYIKLEKFINDNLVDSDKLGDNLLNIKKFINYINSNNFDLEDENYKIILENNPLLNNSFRKIIGGNYITQDYIDSTIEDVNIINEVEKYCQLNDIEILKNNDENYANSNFIKIYLKEIASYPVLSKEEEFDLIRRYQKNHDLVAKDRLLECNLKLVVSIAKKYKGYKSELLDLIQEGNIGLMIALDKFDLSLGYRFSTYATNWIKHEINRVIEEKSKTIRIPNAKVRLLRKYKAKKNELLFKLGRVPTVDDMAIHLKIKVEEALYYENLEVKMVSLNTTSYDFDNELQDFIQDENTNVEDEAITAFSKLELIKLMDCLKESEKEVLLLRFGFYGDKKYKFDDVAEILYKKNITDRQFTREGVRLLEKNALNKLRKNQSIKLLYEDNKAKVKVKK